MARADELRRRGARRAAARIYGQVWTRDDGGAFREEAALRQAELLRAVGETDRARAILQESLQAIPLGPLGPERRALLEDLRPSDR